MPALQCCPIQIATFFFSIQEWEVEKARLFSVYKRTLKIRGLIGATEVENDRIGCFKNCKSSDLF